MDLEKTLVEKTQTAIKEKENSTAVMEVQKLLEYGTLRDTEILRNIGLKSIHAKIEKEYGDLIVFNSIQTATEFSVIKMTHIKEVCEQFRMRYLPCSLYEGLYPPDITTNIKKLEREKTAKLREKNPDAGEYRFDPYLLQTKFMILAPAGLFSLVEEEKPNVQPTRSSNFSTLKAGMTEEQWQRWLKEEPILFYQEDEENAILLKKWGNDFNIFRRILGYITTNWSNFLKSVFTVLFVTLTAILWVFAYKLLVSAGISLVISFITSVLSMPMPNSNFYTSNNWNSRFKI